MITAVDIGGTKTLVAQFTANGELVNRVRFPTPHEFDDFMLALQQQLDSLKDITAISVGVPGIIGAQGQILYCGNLPWRDAPLKKLLSDHYKCPVFLENDANLGALYEINSISPKPKNGLYITVSTGIGSGFVASGKLVPGMRQTEAGHMLLFDGKNWHNWEDSASGKALKKHFGKLAHDLTEPEEWLWLATQLSAGLCALIPMLQPQVIVFGGGVGKYFDSFSLQLTKLLKNRLPDWIAFPELRPAIKPEDAVIYGCYYHATHQEEI